MTCTIRLRSEVHGFRHAKIGQNRPLHALVPSFLLSLGTIREKGARVWARIDRNYKGSVGNVVSTNPITRTALVQRDGVSDNVPVQIDLRNLIDLWVDN